MLSNSDVIAGCYAGGWKDIDMPIEGYRKIAWWFGEFLHNIEKVTRGRFEKMRIKFNDEAVQGDLEGIAGND